MVGYGTTARASFALPGATTTCLPPVATTSGFAQEEVTPNAFTPNQDPRIGAGWTDERQRQRGRTTGHTATDSGGVIQAFQSCWFGGCLCHEEGGVDDADSQFFSQDHQVLTWGAFTQIFRISRANGSVIGVLFFLQRNDLLVDEGDGLGGSIQGEKVLGGAKRFFSSVFSILSSGMS